MFAHFVNYSKLNDIVILYIRLFVCMLLCYTKILTSIIKVEVGILDELEVRILYKYAKLMSKFLCKGPYAKYLR